jgi:hypothetical protein
MMFPLFVFMEMMVTGAVFGLPVTTCFEGKPGAHAGVSIRHSLRPLREDVEFVGAADWRGGTGR